MKRWLMLGLLLAGVAGAENPPPQKDVKTYLDDLQVKLEHTARRTNQPTAEGSSVVGLRGSKQESSNSMKQLYWKGKDAETPVSPEEVKQFRSAVEQARAGQTSEAKVALQSFKDKYPKSPLLPDVEETLKRL